MWLCAIQITHERYGWEVPDEHRTRLVVYLREKNERGFIEFFSGVYIPYTFIALANLYDFSIDEEIKSDNDEDDDSRFLHCVKHENKGQDKADMTYTTVAPPCIGHLSQKADF